MATAAPTARTIFEPEHDDYRESFRRFIEAEVTPYYEEWREAHLVPRELFAKAAEHGFLAMEIPEEYGGVGVDDWRFNAVLIEETAVAGVGDAWAGATIHTDVCMPYFAASATEEQKDRWFAKFATGELLTAIAMTEPGTGSDLAGIKTSAVRDGDDWIINGSKTFITSGQNADLVIVAARTSEDPHRGLTLFVVEDGMEGFERGKSIHKVGQHASDTLELFFNDVRVPHSNMLGEEGSGFFQLVSRLVPERLTLAVAAQAGSERVLEETLTYVKEREAFGRPIGTFQNSRFKMAEMKTKLTVTRAFVDQCIKKYTEGTCGVDEAAMAKWWTTDMACEIADECLQLHGGYGYTTEYGVSRAWTDARIGRIFAGTNEIMKELIGKTMGL